MAGLGLGFLSLHTIGIELLTQCEMIIDNERYFVLTAERLQRSRLCQAQGVGCSFMAILKQTYPCLQC